MKPKGLIVYTVLAAIVSLSAYQLVSNELQYSLWLIFSLLLLSLTWNLGFHLFMDWYWQEKYEYGFIRKRPARKNKRTGKIEILLYKAGERGHKTDFYYDVYDDWDRFFTKEPTSQ